MKMRKAYITMIVLMFSIIIAPSLVSALPPIPRTFWSHDGNSSLNDQPVPAGTVIEAYDPDGALCGNYTVIVTGRFVFNCIGDDPDTVDDEGAVSGDTITFYMNGTSATIVGGSAVWQSGFQEVNIQATSTAASVETQEDGSDAAVGETDLVTSDNTSPEVNASTNQTLVTWGIDLAPGWNLISFPIMPTDNYIPTAFATLGGSFAYLYHYDASIPDPLERWLIWDNTIAEQYWATDNTLQSVEPNRAYWVWLASVTPQTLTVEGTESPCNEVDLYEGWNFVGFQLVDESLVDFREQLLDFLYMYWYDSFISDPLERWLIWDNTLDPINWELNTLTRVEPTKGYWLKVASSQTWVEVPCVPDIDVNPLVYDFGDVEVGTSEIMIVTIANVGAGDLEVNSISFGSGSSDDFSITAAPSIPVLLDPGLSIDVEINFAPDAIGPSTAVLVINSNDPYQGVVEVELSGEGITVEPPPSVTVEEILAFFDASVADGILSGDGPGKSADGRRKALRNMIEAAGDLIDDGYIVEACQQLMDACNRCDDLPRPPDFVDGPARAELAEKIMELIASLGCSI
jgi:hypothetical protein